MSVVDELRTTFLFEKLSDAQLAWVAQHGQIAVYDEAAQVFSEGDPADHFWILLDGGVRLTRTVGREVVTVVETSQRGVYAGAVRAFIPGVQEAGYAQGLVTLQPSRFFRLPAPAFAILMREWFPMATHLLEGLYLGIRSMEATVREREKLAALGSLSAGLAHELNNPAAAAMRAAGQLRERVAAMRHKLALLAEGDLDPNLLRELVRLQEDAADRARKAPQLSAVQEADREDEVIEWLDDHGVTSSWELAAVFVAAGIDTAWTDKVAEQTTPQTLEGALRWLAYTLETEALVGEIEDATSRISTLVGAVKQYSSMDRAPFQDVDLHDGLDSTLVMLAHKLGRVRIVKQYAPDLPRVPAYGGELNQVWTNLIDNAVDAMGGQGTLSIRTAVVDGGVLVEVVDDGPGIPPEVQPRVFDAFFTTKPVGAGNGLGLEISKRIVETRHHGTLTFTSEPGRTSFMVRLPLRVAP
jgi:signal transduction histidine kinase